MQITQGTRLVVHHARKGTFHGIAKEDFDTELTEFYPIVLDNPEGVAGVTKSWKEGEEIPCRSCLCKLEII